MWTATCALPPPQLLPLPASTGGDDSPCNDDYTENRSFNYQCDPNSTDLHYYDHQEYDSSSTDLHYCDHQEYDSSSTDSHGHYRQH
jgi:hypothetical protein